MCVARAWGGLSGPRGEDPSGGGPLGGRAPRGEDPNIANRAKGWRGLPCKRPAEEDAEMAKEEGERAVRRDGPTRQRERERELGWRQTERRERHSLGWGS